MFIGFRQPVIVRQVSFSVASSFFAWAEQHSARADDLSVIGVAPHFAVLSLRMILFLVPTFFFVFSICAIMTTFGSVLRQDTPGGCRS